MAPTAVLLFMRCGKVELLLDSTISLDVAHYHRRPTYHNLHGEARLSQWRQDYMKGNSALFEALDAITADNFRRTAVVDYFCKPECSYRNEEGVPLYFDSNHLTLSGSYILHDVLSEIVRSFE